MSQCATVQPEPSTSSNALNSPRALARDHNHATLSTLLTKARHHHLFLHECLGHDLVPNGLKITKNLNVILPSPELLEEVEAHLTRCSQWLVDRLERHYDQLASSLQAELQHLPPSPQPPLVTHSLLRVTSTSTNLWINSSGGGKRSWPPWRPPKHSCPAIGKDHRPSTRPPKCANALSRPTLRPSHPHNPVPRRTLLPTPRLVSVPCGPPPSPLAFPPAFSFHPLRTFAPRRPAVFGPGFMGSTPIEGKGKPLFYSSVKFHSNLS